MIELTKEERNAINSLKRLAKRWPKSLWLFSAGGELHVMKCNKAGDRAITPPGPNHFLVTESVDPDFSVCTINVPNDGGDW